jgi:hypothetical protein
VELKPSDVLAFSGFVRWHSVSGYQFLAHKMPSSIFFNNYPEIQDMKFHDLVICQCQCGVVKMLEGSLDHRNRQRYSLTTPRAPLARQMEGKDCQFPVSSYLSTDNHLARKYSSVS